ncbi:hypothetical protein E8E11_005218 [Didymella keratinophila]|nr:hypothetical protein E8E11_005218 [Didymella keratinophila]
MSSADADIRRLNTLTNGEYSPHISLGYLGDATYRFIPSTQLLAPTEAVPEDQPAPYYVDHENPTKDQKEDVEAEIPLYQMGCRSHARPKRRKTTTDKAKIFSKSWTDTGFVLTMRISSSGEAGTVRIFANIRTLDFDAGGCYLDPYWGYFDGEYVWRAGAPIAEDAMELGATHEWNLPPPDESPQAIKQDFALTSCVQRDDGELARLPVPDPKVAIDSAKSAY